MRNRKFSCCGLTKRSTSGKVTHHLVPRGFDSSQETEGASIEP